MENWYKWYSWWIYFEVTKISTISLISYINDLMKSTNYLYKVWNYTMAKRNRNVNHDVQTIMWLNLTFDWLKFTSFNLHKSKQILVPNDLIYDSCYLITS